ncbi:MAG: MMPL family transporter [Candidatus Riflebacteria bacterium]|nr:MMPL family transporter [Candidatus Riflebacteria bacterium]
MAPTLADRAAARLTALGTRASLGLALGRPRLTLLAGLLLTLALGWAAVTNTFDYDLRALFGGRGEVFDRFEECVALFGSDDELVLSWPLPAAARLPPADSPPASQPGPDLAPPLLFTVPAGPGGPASGTVNLTPTDLARSLAVRQAVASLPGVEYVFDLTAALGIDHPGKLAWLADRPRLLQRRLAAVTGSRMAGPLLVGRGGKALAAYLRTARLDNPGKHALVRRVRAALAGLPGGEEVRLVGYQVFGERYVTLMMSGNARFAALSLSGALLVSLLLFRSLWLTASVVVAILFPAIWTQGLYALLGYRISLFSGLLTPLILFVGLSLSIQFVARFRLALERLPVTGPRTKAGDGPPAAGPSSAMAPGSPPAAFATGPLSGNSTDGDVPPPPGPWPGAEADPRAVALREAILEAWPPSALCALTTFVGFASQAVSTMPGIRAFGILSSAGCAFAFLGVFLLLPALLRCGPRPAADRVGASLIPACERVFGRWTARWTPPAGWAPVIAGLMLAVAVTGMARLEFGSDPLAALPADDRVVRDQAFWQHHFAGSGRQVSLVCRFPGPALDTLAGLAALERYAAAVAADPEVAQVLSPTALVRDILDEVAGNRGAAPRTDAAVARAFRLAVARAPRLLAGLTNPPHYDRARLVVNLRRPNAPLVVAAAVRLEALAAGLPEPFPTTGDSPPLLTASATGRMWLAAVIETDALHMEVSSFAGALAWIIVLFALFFRRARDVWVAVVVNVLPIGLTLGLMGLLGVALNPVTLMVPCIGLGIVVDDTIHLIHEMRREAARGHGPRRARAHVMLRIGWAIVSTSAILIVGMAVLGLSDFAPIREFGLFGALALAIGMLTDLCLTTALLLEPRPRPATPPDQEPAGP